MLRPKRGIGLIICVVAVVIILILGIVLADYFVFKAIIFKEGKEKIRESGEWWCTLSVSTSGTESGKTQVNVTWTVGGPSRANIRWSDIPQSYAKVLCNGTVIAQTTNYTWQAWPTGIYVTGGDTMTVTLNRTAVASGSVVKLVLVYAPSGGTVGESSVTLDYTA